MNNYWDEINWEKHLKEDNLNNIEDNWVEEYLKYIPKERKILDLGCGVDQYANYYSKLGYNISSKAIKELNKNNSNIKTKLQDMSENLNYNDNEFDVIFANLSIQFLMIYLHWNY